MLPRVLEPEVMDSPAEARDYDAMDHAGVNRVFVADFLRFFPEVTTVLDVGTGTAQIPIELCRQFDLTHRRTPAEAWDGSPEPSFRLDGSGEPSHKTRQPPSGNAQLTVVGVDLAAHMLALGRANVHRARLDARITLQRVDAKGLPWPANSFGSVISNSIVHHIPEPAAALAEMIRVAATTLFIRDLLRPDTDSEVHHLVNLYAASVDAHQRQMFDDSLRAALTLDEIRALVGAQGYDPASVQTTSDRHWTWTAFKT